jgi:hypothetical protein
MTTPSPPTAAGKQLTATDTEVRRPSARRRQRDRLPSPLRPWRACHRPCPHRSPAGPKGRLHRTASAIDSALRLAVPEIEALLDAAFPRYRSTALLTSPLTRLLGLYRPEASAPPSARPSRAAHPRAPPSSTWLEKHRRTAQRRPPLPVDVTDRPDLAAFHVQSPTHLRLPTNSPRPQRRMPRNDLPARLRALGPHATVAGLDLSTSAAVDILYVLQYYSTFYCL